MNSGRGLRFAAGVAIAVMLAVPAGAQRIRGRVVDSTNTPLAGAQVLILPDSVRATTDDSGAFAVGPLSAGGHELRVRRIGYQQVIRPLTTPLLGDSIMITMMPSPVMLAAVRTMALQQKLPRILQRQQEHLGAVLYGAALRDVLDRGSGMTVEELLTFDRAMALKMMSARGCPSATYVDGVATRAPISFYIDKDDIAAIEVFNSPDFVHEPFVDDSAYRVGTCLQLILIWSKEYQQRPWGGR